jgi:dTDP-4-dehydrorhamnose 3,5-epimerase
MIYMKFEKTNFEGLFLIKPEVLGDNRGWFMRTFSKDLFVANINNLNTEWVQMNHSCSKEKGTWRGFHFQNSPFQEAKLIRCIKGSVLDCALDLRKGSKTFLKIFKTELSSEMKTMVYIPKGFAHGFLTLEENSELIYLHDEFYHPESESGIYYKDPLIDLDIQPQNISERDQTHNLLSKEFKGI